MNELISIIVPVYNVSEYLSICLESLLKQTYENIEIIVINDGSTDNSREICDHYVMKYPEKVRVLHMRNQGVSTARNVGLEVAEGEYLAFVDGDDWIEPEMIEILYKLIVDYDVDMSSCGVKQDYGDGKQVLYKESIVQKCNQTELLKAILSNKEVYGYVCNKLFKKSLIKKLQFDRNLRTCEDLEFTVRYAERCIAGVYTLSELYHYRMHRESVTGDFNYNPGKLSIISAYEKIMPIYEKLCPECIYILLRNYLKINLNIIGRMRISDCKNREVELQLLNNVRSTYKIVMKDRKNSLLIRGNIMLTRIFPEEILRIKQFILKRKYE